MARLHLVQPIEPVIRYKRPFFALLPKPKAPELPIDCTASLSGSEVVWRNADGVEVARTKASASSLSAAM